MNRLWIIGLSISKTDVRGPDRAQVLHGLALATATLHTTTHRPCGECGGVQQGATVLTLLRNWRIKMDAKLNSKTHCKIHFTFFEQACVRLASTFAKIE